MIKAALLLYCLASSCVPGLFRNITRLEKVASLSPLTLCHLVLECGLFEWLAPAGRDHIHARSTLIGGSPIIAETIRRVSLQCGDASNKFLIDFFACATVIPVVTDTTEFNQQAG
jgi:hypothetical protein